MKTRLIVFFILVFFLSVAPAHALGDLIKSASSPTVYYLDGNNFRHPFPTQAVYETWYADFSGVKTVSPETITDYPLAENIKVRPGVALVTFETDKNIYAATPGGILRPFKERDLIQRMYGDKWFEKAVKVPEAFFGDYLIGEEMKYDHELPDGMLYLWDGKYYYNDNGLLWPFKDLAAVKANGFKTSDAVKGNIALDKRAKEISFLNTRIFNPVAKPNATTADCENKKLKAAFILAAKTQPSQDEIDKLTAIKNRLAENFVFATKGLAKLDVSYPIIILSDDETLFFRDRDGQLKPDNEVINTFFDQNPDNFDFIILYNNFVLNESVVAKYVLTNNDFLGTGNSQVHYSFFYGSRGKLKGIANMGNLLKYGLGNTADLDQSVNYIIHEIAHHWSGRAIFQDENGEVNYALLAGTEKNHWNIYVDFISPLGGNGWQDNGDGAFTSKITLASEPNRKVFSNLDLYFMGLLPTPFVGPIKYLAPDEPGAVGNVLRGELKEVLIDQIVDTMGEWGCRI
ncbi:MAG: hypothetical protein AAB358_01735 [Patescibacteria group bacterium]